MHPQLKICVHMSVNSPVRSSTWSLQAEVRESLEQRLTHIATSIAGAFGATANVRYQRNYPVTANSPEETLYCIEAARAVAGADAVDTDTPPSMGGEDFAYMLQQRPGAFIFIGNGPSAGLHHPAYDFNDSIISTGLAYWEKLVEARLGA